MTKEQKRIEWESRVLAWKESGLSVPKWCQEHNLKDYQLYYWIKKLEVSDTKPLQQDSDTKWLAVEVANEDKPSPHGSVVIHIGKASVEVHPGTDPNLLANVVHVLHTQC
ncbi:IS66 family insertion sequence element accessory protein TnpA [Radiobacillus sp. PE A8.2]|uniref:IS66 family insertion sequence element accessory protein TnpA n=1 Tax=Radiobacillus sp. PE A8.2 TaxID=3380349 RepID=UPI00388E4C70